ncbi:MAG: MBL fold metallo-hydrolase [Candidatus Dormibacteraceae bacterium]
MKVRFWGTRGTRPTPGPRTLRYGGNTACVEVRTGSGELIIIDSGSGIAELGSALGDRPLRAHLLITHTHWDHIQGFPFFAPNFVPGTRLTVVGPGGSMRSLQEAFADQMAPAYFPLRLEEMPAGVEFIERRAGEVFEVGGARITPHLLNHPVATFGYRVEEAGRAFVFATDNEPPAAGGGDGHRALVDWCRDADLLAHDAQYSADEYRSRVGWGHATFEYALRVAHESGAGRLAFYHHDPAHSDDEVDVLVGRALDEDSRTRAGNRPEAFPAAEDRDLSV